MSSKIFLQFEFETHNQEELEKLVALLSEQRFDGFIEEDLFLTAFIEQDEFIQQDFENTLEKFSILAYTMSEVEQINWNQKWEQDFHPVVVERFAGIRAGFHEPLKNVQHEIIITPKMSFGTGHHATTYMMIQLMKEIDFVGKTVLDFGTGTGVLAILAEKLGAASVTAIDNDEWSITNAAENLEQNNCSSIKLKLASEIPPGGFDIVLANINLNVIINNLKAIDQSCRNGALILLSGFLQSDEQQIVSAAADHNLLKMKALKKGEWLALLCKNKSA